MTPEQKNFYRNLVRQFSETQAMVSGFNLKDLSEMLDAHDRLAAIEGAGDEEVDAACSGLLKAYRSLDDNLFHRSMNSLDDIAKSRNATIADLRAKLGEATELLRTLYDSPSIGEVAHDDTYYRLEKFVTESEVQGGL